MRLYVASSWRNPSQPEVVDQLRAAGHEVYDFRNPHMGPGARGHGFHWSEIDEEWEQWAPGAFRGALHHPTARDGFASDKAGCDWAEAGVLLLPCGRSAHLEAGYMAGRGKPVVALIEDPCEPELMYGFLEAIACSRPELLLTLDVLRIAGPRRRP